MAKHRMCPCALGKPWTFFGPEHQCPKHKEAEPDVVAARVAWVNKPTAKRIST